MHSTLAQVIQAFRGAQDLAVATLVERLGIPRPESNVAWAKRMQAAEACNGLDVHERGQAHGLHVRAHGYGVEIRFPNLTIDFDWGDNGEGNGFDVWRLWNHCSINHLFLDQVTHELLEQQVQRAVADGELITGRLLFYLASERCPKVI